MSSKRFLSDVREAVGAHVAAGGPAPRCILCGSPRVEYGGVWLPTEAIQVKLLVPSSKYRAIAYFLCARCTRLPDMMTRVEDYVLAEFAALATSPLRN